MCRCYRQDTLTTCNGASNASHPERGSKCSLLTEAAGGGTASRTDVNGGSREVSEMGCSSGRLPCQPPASVQLATLEPESSLTSAAGAKPPEDLSTLERLAQATGGTEKSWYRCVFPFGVISLVIGMAGTGVTFTFNTPAQTKVVALVLLAVGLVMLLIAAVCWKVHRSRRREKEGGIFSSEQGNL